MIKLEVNQKDINQVFSWIKEKGNNLDSLWNKIIPIMKDQVKYEFSDANPNRWKALSKTYKKWKEEHGYPSTIGVRKGTLKDAATNNAVIKKSKKYMEYGVDTDRVVENGIKYAFEFNKKREIFKYTHRYMDHLVDKAADEWIEKELKRD